MKEEEREVSTKISLILSFNIHTTLTSDDIQNDACGQN